VTALLVTGTGSGVGTTVVSAALAALALWRGQRCTVVKPAQTGVPDGAPADLEVVRRLAGGQVRTVELARYPEALSPAAAARISAREPVDPALCAHAVLQAQKDGDLVLVDGAGGLLVRYDEDGFTMAQLARTLRLPVVVVVAPGGDTLNSTALTLEALAHRGVELTGLVVGAWPAAPVTAELAAVADLEMLAARPLLGALPAGLGARDQADFLATARAGLSPALGGTFDAAAFRRRALSAQPEKEVGP
jgi:dethiobiotin synthetase